MKIISGYTISTPYEKEVQLLTNSLTSLGINYTLYPYKSTGNWVHNCAKKPEIIIQCMEEFGEEVIWLDADSIVKKYPNIFFSNELKEYTVGAGYIESRKELLSGCLYFNNTSDSYNLLKSWKEKCIVDSNIWDQKNLQELVESNAIKLFKFPLSYVKIFDWWKSVDPVILQNQASRRFKFKV